MSKKLALKTDLDDAIYHLQMALSYLNGAKKLLEENGKVEK